jgi:hypothetical protein
MPFSARHLNNSVSFDTAAAIVTLINEITNHTHDIQHCFLIDIMVTFPVWGSEKSSPYLPIDSYVNPTRMSIIVLQKI